MGPKLDMRENSDESAFRQPLKSILPFISYSLGTENVPRIQNKTRFSAFKKEKRAFITENNLDRILFYTLCCIFRDILTQRTAG